MSKCGFYQCANDGEIEARFVNNATVVDVKLCERHDKETKGGQPMAVLFDRALDRERQP